MNQPIMKPVITIGFPVYNVERFVERSLKSALEQDFDLPYEVLVIDDCGTDGSMNVVRDLAASHHKGDCIRIVKHSVNKGLGEASNTIIDNAYGEWLLYLDSDDSLTPDCLRLLYEKAVTENADFVIGNTLMVDEVRKETINHGAFTNQAIRHDSAAVYMLVKEFDHPGHERWNKLYNIHFLRDNRIRCRHRIMEDLIWGFTAYAYSQCVVTVNKTTYLYNNSPRESIMAVVQGHNDKILPKEVLDIYVSVIQNMQKIILKEFANSKYVYDMYFYIIEAIWKTLKHTAPQNLQYISDKTLGFATIVPNMFHLQNQYNRFFYILANTNNASILDYINIRMKADRKVWRSLRWIVARL